RGYLRGAELNELQREIARYIARIPELPRTDVMYEDRDRPESLKQLAHMKRNGILCVADRASQMDRRRRGACRRQGSPAGTGMVQQGSGLQLRDAATPGRLLLHVRTERSGHHVAGARPRR